MLQKRWRDSVRTWGSAGLHLIDGVTKLWQSEGGNLRVCLCRSQLTLQQAVFGTVLFAKAKFADAGIVVDENIGFSFIGCDEATLEDHCLI